METNVICIGRNIGSTPMPQLRWVTFIGDITSMLLHYDAVIINEAIGVGHWEGITEDTFVVTFQIAQLDEIWDALPMFAWLYEQESIALIVGVGVLIS